MVLRLAYPVSLAAWLGGPLVAAGTPRWAAYWAYVAVLVVGLALHQAYVARRNPELRRRRGQVGAGTKPWDFWWNLAFWPLMATVPVVAGLDARLAWSPMDPAGFAAGVGLFAAGMFLSGWAMGCNPFFEGTVRIQVERGHHVVDVGPYRAIRHPGYAGLCLWAIASPFLLLSWWAFVPAAVVVAWIVLRTALEDRTLRRELNGYEAFARRTRYRLLPGAW